MYPQYLREFGNHQTLHRPGQRVWSAYVLASLPSCQCFIECPWASVALGMLSRTLAPLQRWLQLGRCSPWLDSNLGIFTQAHPYAAVTDAWCVADRQHTPKSRRACSRRVPNGTSMRRGTTHTDVHNYCEQLPNHGHRNLKSFEEHIQMYCLVCVFTELYRSVLG